MSPSKKGKNSQELQQTPLFSTLATAGGLVGAEGGEQEEALAAGVVRAHRRAQLPRRVPGQAGQHRGEEGGQEAQNEGSPTGARALGPRCLNPMSPLTTDDVVTSA